MKLGRQNATERNGKMEYKESYTDRRKMNSSLYIILAVVLLVIGAIAWFAMSRIADEGNDKTRNNPPVASDIEQNNGNNTNSSEYRDNTSSYNESIIPAPGTGNNNSQPAADSVSDQPYTSEPEKKPVVYVMPVEGKVIKEFSDTTLQYSSTYSDMRLHTGVDIACKEGTSVSACADGTVVSIELNTSMGNVVTINHKNGITAKYASIGNITVEKGNSVKAGDIIGTVSTVPSECNDEAHLHFEIYKNDKAVDPFTTLGLK